MVDLRHESFPPGALARGLFVAAVLSLGIAGFSIVLAITSKHGPGMTPDSAQYISCAEHLLAGDGFTNYDGVFVQWPPLYPAILASFGAVGFDQIQAARFFNALCLGLIVVLSFVLLVRTLESTVLALLGTATIVIAPALMFISVYVWSEPFFTLLSLAFLIKLADYIEKDNISDLVACGVIVALACLQKYLGVALILAGGLMIVVVGFKTFDLRRIWRAALFATLASLPLALWLGRNLIVASTLTGRTNRPPYTFTHFIDGFMTVGWSWVIPFKLSLGVMLIGALIPAILFAIMFFISSRSADDGPSRKLIHVKVMAGFVIVYLAFVLVITFALKMQPMLDFPRYLTPLYVPVLVLLLWTAEAAKNFVCARFALSARSQASLGGLIVTALVAWCFLHPVQIARAQFPKWKNEGLVFSSASWSENEVIRWMIEHPIDGRIESNGPDAILANTDSRASFFSFHKEGGMDDLRAKLENGESIYFVWFNSIRRPYLLSKDRLVVMMRRLGKIEEQFGGATGNVWLISAHEGEPAAAE